MFSIIFKIKLLLICFFLVSFSFFSQTSCEKFNKIKSLKKTIPVNQRLNSATLIQAHLYWSKRCACESGAITGGTWDYSVEVANRVYSSFKSGNYKDYNGPSYPIPDKKMSVGDCLNNNNFNVTPNISDCITNTFSNEDDPQKYGNDFMLAKCECINGVPNLERAKQLEKRMKIDFELARKAYNSSLKLPEPLSYKDCPIINFLGLKKISERDLSRDEQIELLNFTKDLETDLNVDNFNQKYTNYGNAILQNLMKEMRKLSVNTNTQQNKLNNKTKSTINTYSIGKCNYLKSEMDTAYKSLSSFLTLAVSNPEKAFQNLQKLNNLFIKYNNNFSKALSENLLSPQCITELQSKTDNFSLKFQSTMSQLLNKLKN